MSDTIALQSGSHRLKTLRFIGDYTGPSALLVFGVALWYLGKHENIFSFGAWGTLDLLTGIALLRSSDPADKKAANLPLAYGVIAFFAAAMIYNNGKWEWGIVETVCLVGTVVALIGWYRSGELFAVVAFNTAMCIASIPILVSNYHDPQTWEWWLWVGSFVSATIGLYLTYPWRLSNIKSWLFVAVSEVVTISMLILLFRPYF
jgi:hypothetical protein